MNNNMKKYNNKPENTRPAAQPEEQVLSESSAIFGRNAVHELQKSGRQIDKLFVQKGEREGSISVIIAEAKAAGVPVIEVEKQKLDRLSGGGRHQGVAAYAAEKEYVEIEDILEIAKQRGEEPLIIITDGIEDPYNLGAVIRTAECDGAHGVIIPKRRSATLTPVVAKASAGALEHMAVCKTPNISAAIDRLKELGVWIYGAEAGGKPYYESDFSGPCAVVLGSEGGGISRLVREKCDYIVSIPIYGNVNSLNVSAAAAVIVTEAARQHRNKK